MKKALKILGKTLKVLGIILGIVIILYSTYTIVKIFMKK